MPSSARRNSNASRAPEPPPDRRTERFAAVTGWAGEERQGGPADEGVRACSLAAVLDWRPLVRGRGRGDTVSALRPIEPVRRSAPRPFPPASDRTVSRALKPGSQARSGVRMAPWQNLKSITS